MRGFSTPKSWWEPFSFIFFGFFFVFEQFLSQSLNYVAYGVLGIHCGQNLSKTFDNISKSKPSRQNTREHQLHHNWIQGLDNALSHTLGYTGNFCFPFSTSKT